MAAIVLKPFSAEKALGKLRFAQSLFCHSKKALGKSRLLAEAFFPAPCWVQAGKKPWERKHFSFK